MVHKKRFNKRKRLTITRNIIDTLKSVTSDRRSSEIKKKEININGFFVRCSSYTLATFKYKGTKCAGCGIQGVFLAVEEDLVTGKLHLHLYAIDAVGDEVLMTSDHIIPKSRGGRNSLENRQTMCKVCNELKGSNI